MTNAITSNTPNRSQIDSNRNTAAQEKKTTTTEGNISSEHQKVAQSLSNQIKTSQKNRYNTAPNLINKSACSPLKNILSILYKKPKIAQQTMIKPKIEEKPIAPLLKPYQSRLEKIELKAPNTSLESDTKPTAETAETAETAKKRYSMNEKGKSILLPATKTIQPNKENTPLSFKDSNKLFDQSDSDSDSSLENNRSSFKNLEVGESSLEQPQEPPKKTTFEERRDNIKRIYKENKREYEKKYKPTIKSRVKEKLDEQKLKKEINKIRKLEKKAPRTKNVTPTATQRLKKNNFGQIKNTNIKNHQTHSEIENKKLTQPENDQKKHTLAELFQKENDDNLILDKPKNDQKKHTLAELFQKEDDDNLILDKPNE